MVLHCMSRALNRMTERAKNAGGACIQFLNGRGGPILVACVCLALAYKNRPRGTPTARRPVLHRSLSMAALHGGQVALQRILDSQEARVDPAALEDAERHLRDLLSPQDRLNFNKLQRATAKLEMSGKEGVAVEMLWKAWEKAEKEGHPHEAHELQMLLAEMLIYKMDYKEALDCSCLYDKEISDARGPLYKAIIYTILGNKTRAEECYNEFQNIRARFYGSDSINNGSPLHDVVRDFAHFEKIVNNLKNEIEQAHKTTKDSEETKRLNMSGSVWSSAKPSTKEQT